VTTQRTPRPKSRIPRFKSIAEEAAFWDTHSLADFADELEPVADVRFVVMRAGPKKPLTVRLPEDTLKTLTQHAHAQGVGASTLVRMWILERLRGQTPKPS
jgi:hypothetical protein